MTEFDFATLEHRLRELAFLNSGVTIVLSDMRHAVEKREELRYEGGVEAFVKYLDRNKSPLVPVPITIKAERDGMMVECALWWNDGYHEACSASPTTSRSATAARTLRASAAHSPARSPAMRKGGGVAKKEKVALTGDDCREGLTAVLSVKVPDPKFVVADQGQARLLRGPPGGRGVLNDALKAWLERIPRRPRSSSARWSRPPRRARRPARRAR